MFYNSRTVAILIGLTVAILTTSFLGLQKNVPIEAFIITFSVSLASAFMLTYVSLEYFVFSEISKIFGQLEKFKRKDLNKLKKNIYRSNNPLKQINEEINALAFESQQEINELKKLANFRREFLADISHELKNPIFAAQGYIHTLLDGAKDDIDVRDKFLLKAAKTLDDLDVLVHDLISISQIESGELKMHMSPVNLVELCEQVYTSYEDRAKEKKISLNFDKKNPASVIVSADIKWLKQVMNNLVENAINYGNEKGNVSIKFEETKSKVIVSVTDDGPGISPEHHKRIFERFYRVEKSRNKGKGGTGLGLAIVKHIVDAHDSKIKLESSEGKGTTFNFMLKKYVHPDSNDHK